jgi:hypothetical protein
MLLTSSQFYWHRSHIVSILVYYCGHVSCRLSNSPYSAVFGEGESTYSMLRHCEMVCDGDRNHNVWIMSPITCLQHMSFGIVFYQFVNVPLCSPYERQKLMTNCMLKANRYGEGLVCVIDSTMTSCHRRCLVVAPSHDVMS